MSYRSLRDFIARLEAAGDLVRVREPVSTVLEMTEIQTRLIANGGPAVLFEKPVKADGQLQGSPSALFDAVAVILDEAGAKTLSSEGAVVKWVMDAYGHLKGIGASEAAKPLLDRAGVETDEGVSGLDEAFFEAAKTRQWDREPKLRTLA